MYSSPTLTNQVPNLGPARSDKIVLLTYVDMPVLQLKIDTGSEYYMNQASIHYI